jgi:hypothetical protein
MEERLPDILIAPSIRTADFARLGEAISDVIAAGAGVEDQAGPARRDAQASSSGQARPEDPRHAPRWRSFVREAFG